MKERPIIFNGEMVRATLEGRKTMTRRPVKPQPKVYEMHEMPSGKPIRWIAAKCPYGQPGDRLWVRETIIQQPQNRGRYKAGADWLDFPKDYEYPRNRIIPSIHMPRWASRITLEIVKVRVERLQEISYNDIIAEGFSWLLTDEIQTDAEHKYWARKIFSDYWDSLYTKKPEYQWQANPWVWVVDFQPCQNYVKHTR